MLKAVVCARKRRDKTVGDEDGEVGSEHAPRTNELPHSIRGHNQEAVLWLQTMGDHLASAMGTRKAMREYVSGSTQVRARMRAGFLDGCPKTGWLEKLPKLEKVVATVTATPAVKAYYAGKAASNKVFAAHAGE